MKTHLILLSLILVPLLLFGNNGKITFANKINDFSLDGNLNEWEHLRPIPIDLYLGDYSNPTADCEATFKSAYHKNQLFFAIQVEDDNVVSNTNSEWHTNDAVVLYLNFCHANDQSGVARIILNQEKLEVQTHGPRQAYYNPFLRLIKNDMTIRIV